MPMFPDVFGDLRRRFRSIFVGAASALAPAIIDELGNALVDELGGAIRGQDASGPATIKAAAAARGVTYGIAYKSDHNLDTTAYRNLVLSEAAMLVPEVAAQSAVWCSARNTFDFGRLGSHVDVAKAAGLPWKVPSGFVYPAHDCSWISTNDGTNINAVSDGTGQPAVRAATYQAIIDEMVAAFRAFCLSKGSYPTAINASNELIDRVQSDGLRRHPWYTATSGPGWLVYLIQKLRAAFPGVPVGVCQDLTEQPSNNGLGAGIRTAFLNMLDALANAGAKPDYVDLQGHLVLERGWDPVAFRTFLQSIRDRGVQIVAGEIDCRVTTPAGYTTTGYDIAIRELLAQYLDVLIPFLDGGLIAVWGLGDAYNAWGSDQRPLLYDTNLAAKPLYYASFRDQLLWR